MKFQVGDQILAMCLQDPAIGIRGWAGEVTEVITDYDGVGLYRVSLPDRGVVYGFTLRDHDLTFDTNWHKGSLVMI